MTDRELLELAAKAAGIQGQYLDDENGISQPITDDCGGYDFWNPLTDDGDALRLAVKLQISPVWYELSVDALAAGRAHATVMLKEVPDVAAATRLAITRAAAAIGEAMP